jgi:hypothetical protein
MGHELIFIMQRGEHEGILLMFGDGKKMIQFYSNPKFGVGMNVWS